MRTRFILFALAAALTSPVVAQNPPPTDDQPSPTTDNTEQSPSLPDINEPSSTSAASQTTETSEVPTIAPPVPNITTDPGAPPSLPPIPTTAGAGVSFSYPPATVPPTQNAPFMQKSNLPDGTVFIAVGAILGAFGVAILIWRAAVAYLLHRSVRRATLAQQVANDKKSYPPPAPPFYKYSDHASSGSVGNTPAARGVRKSRVPVPSSTASQSNLFFSPTAPAPAPAAGGGNRESRFLPSGFYASGAASPQGPQGPSISMTNLRPDSYAHARSFEPSPPESPLLAPRHETGRRNPSTSTINLNRPASGRAPSAFLEDLLGDQSEQFPPPGHRNNWQQPPGRF
ncbi:hypothetical protein GGS21DRAFT_9967 [Xylaria nigripes]|nr:hypothetical protein GGS21DRAFT_9967 [Xylaria nigripes]